jgi:hypothetical protein
MKKIVIATLVLFFATNTFAQKDKSKKEIRRDARKEKVSAMVKLEEEGVIVNKKHFLSAMKLTNDGFGGFIEKGLAQSVGKALLFQLELTERFHPKEEKQTNVFTNGAGPYKYGKINYFYPVKLGVQQQILLGNKGNRNGLSVTANFGGGISLGLERPYLLGFDSIVNNVREIVYKKYSQDTIGFLNGSNVAGPGFGKGFNKMKVNPGLYIKTGLRFDYGAYNEQISAVEVGLTAEFYSKKVQQMAKINGKNLFFGAYVALLFGKRK